MTNPTPHPAAAADLPEALDQLFENLNDRVYEWSNYVRADDAPTTLPKYVAGAIKELRSAVESLHALTASAPAASSAASFRNLDSAALVTIREMLVRDPAACAGTAVKMIDAMLAQQAAPQAGAESYPPLPEAMDLGFDATEGVHIYGYTADDMRAYVDADRAQRLPLTDVQCDAIAEALSMFYARQNGDDWFSHISNSERSKRHRANRKQRRNDAIRNAINTPPRPDAGND